MFFWKRKDDSTAQPDAAPVASDSPGEETATVDSQPHVGEPQASGTESEAPAKPGFLGRIAAGLTDRLRKTRNEFVGQIREVVKAASIVDENVIEQIEEILIRADIGAETTFRIVEEMRQFEARGARTDELMASFKKQLFDIVSRNEKPLKLAGKKPHVVLIIGVNGTGKTTTIGKLAAQFRADGRSTMLAAGDTFRAAAVEQLEIWANRTGSAFVSRGMGSDSSGTAYEAVEKAMAAGTDVLLIDTAGRLHTKSNLMEELKKVVRVIQKLIPDAPHETVLVLDATTGQNAIQQAKIFGEATPISGIVMTKLDGTAKGGVLIGVCNLFPIPIYKIGVGEGIDDLRDFRAKEFVDALFDEES